MAINSREIQHNSHLSDINFSNGLTVNRETEIETQHLVNTANEKQSIPEQKNGIINGESETQPEKLINDNNDETLENNITNDTIMMEEDEGEDKTFNKERSTEIKVTDNLTPNSLNKNVIDQKTDILNTSESYPQVVTQPPLPLDEYNPPPPPSYTQEQNGDMISNTQTNQSPSHNWDDKSRSSSHTRRLNRNDLWPAVIDVPHINWLFRSSDVQLNTPSIKDGFVSGKYEKAIRVKGINFIIAICTGIKLPRMSILTASVFFHRFYMRNSFKTVHQYELAATAVFLATKVEESHRKLRDLIRISAKIASKNPQLQIDEQTKEFWKWRDLILNHEIKLLEALCFDLEIDSPYEMLTDISRDLNPSVDDLKKLNVAWIFVDESTRTTLCLTHNFTTLAVAAIYYAAYIGEVRLPDRWWKQYNVQLLDIIEVVNIMAEFYSFFTAIINPGGAVTKYRKLPVPVIKPFSSQESATNNRSSSPQN